MFQFTTHWWTVAIFLNKYITSQTDWISARFRRVHTCNNMHPTRNCQYQIKYDIYDSLVTFSFSFFLVSSVSPGLSWRVRWCRKSPSRGPTSWRRRSRVRRRTTAEWRRETDSSSNARSQPRSPGVWLWGVKFRAGGKHSRKTYMTQGRESKDTLCFLYFADQMLRKAQSKSTGK